MDKKNELLDFFEKSDFRPSRKLDKTILQFVKKELIPNHKKIFGKLFLIQAFVGTLVLLFCPQFNFSLTGSYEVFHFFHRHLGMYGCTAVCGGIFLGSGLFVANFILERGEIAVIKKSKFLYSTALSGLCILIFIFAGAEIYLDLSLIWLIGSSLVAIITFEFGRFIRDYFFFLGVNHP
ncbi:MAG: hypothetical protein DRQ88_09580 [Epsilonproteobacteria bacterium]|nr:MAG: hypothetical protein DRQ89_06735 [Campylobacterota bacterium]RLA65316.1 MAG: hypothetical protein DRQ88_09580 [Campylobacterota bacterium]